MRQYQYTECAPASYVCRVRFRLTWIALPTLMQKEVKKVVAVLSDLFFSAKIVETAKRCGLAVEFVTDGTQLRERAAARPALIIFDLNFEGIEPLQAIAELKGNAQTKSISLLGYLSHVQGELKQQAQEAGCDMVMARSAFSQNLSQIFKRHSGVL